MSASNITVHTVDKYNFYTVTTDGKKFIIGGVPYELCQDYVNEAIKCDGIILLTSKPEFCGGLDKVLDSRPDIEIYATSAGLRNIKEIVNRDINEHLIKDMSEISGIKFFVIPNVHWVDSAAVMYEHALFSGELFSGGDNLEEYYKDTLSVNRSFVQLATQRIKELNPHIIYPSIGKAEHDTASLLSAYEKLTHEYGHNKTATVLYHSTYSFTKAMAEYVAQLLGAEFEVNLIDSAKTDAGYATDCINSSDIIAVGTNTINRNAPKAIWDIITGIDTVNKRNMPYFVFGSFGWAGDGIKLISKTLSALGLKEITKPVEVLFKPKDEDFAKLRKATEKLIKYSNGDE